MSRRRVWQGLLDWWRPRPLPISTSQTAYLEGLRPVPVPISDWTESGPPSAGELYRDSLVLNPEAADFTDELEITDDELQEFMDGDLDPVEADPEFRDQLRDQLWAMVESGEVGGRRDH